MGDIRLMLRLFLLMLVVFLGCAQKKNEDSTQSEQQESFMNLYNEKWSQHEINDKELKRKISTLLSTQKYKAIWNWDTDADGVKEFFCVVSDPVIKKGIIKGVLIDEKGQVKLLFDCVKGIYTKDYFVYDFNRMGIIPNEIKCFRLLFFNKEMQCNADKINRYKMKLPAGRKITLHDIFSFQLIDYKNNLFGVFSGYGEKDQLQYSSFFIDKSISIQPFNIRWTIMNPRGTAESVIYANYKILFIKYRASANKIKVYNE